MSKVLTEEEVLSLLAKVASLHPWRHEVNFLRDYITTLQSERDALREALVKLLDKLDAIAEATKGIYTLAHVHGMGYQGPNWSLEYEAARKLLSTQVSKESVQPPASERSLCKCILCEQWHDTLECPTPASREPARKP